MYSGAPNMEGSDKNLRHPGVWGQGYCYRGRDVVFPAPEST